MLALNSKSHLIGLLAFSFSTVIFFSFCFSSCKGSKEVVKRNLGVDRGLELSARTDTVAIGPTSGHGLLINIKNKTFYKWDSLNATINIIKGEEQVSMSPEDRNFRITLKGDDNFHKTIPFVVPSQHGEILFEVKLSMDTFQTSEHADLPATRVEDDYYEESACEVNLVASSTPVSDNGIYNVELLLTQADVLCSFKSYGCEGLIRLDDPLTMKPHVVFLTPLTFSLDSITPGQSVVKKFSFQIDKTNTIFDKIHFILEISECTSGHGIEPMRFHCNLN